MSVRVYDANGIIQQATMAGGGADGFNIVRAGTTGTTGTVWSSSQATIEINGSQNITVSQNNSNQIVVVGPSLAAYLTTAALSNHSHGFSASGGSSAFQTLNFVNGNGITFTNNAGSVGASHNGLTTARASNDAIGLNTALTGNGVAWTVNSSGLSLNVPAFLTTAAQSNHSHGNPTLALTNLSGTTGSASNGLTLSLSAAATVAQTNQTIGGYAVGNTTGQSSSSTFDARSLTISGAGIASVGYSGGSVIVSVPAGGGGGDGYNIVSLGTTGTTGTAWSSLSASVALNGSGNITVSQNNSNQLVISGPSYGTTTAGTNVTMTLANASNGIALSVSAGAGGGGTTVSSLVPDGMYPGSTASQTLGAMGVSTGSIFMCPFTVRDSIVFDHIMLGMALSYATSTVSGQQTISFLYALYSNNASTLSQISSSSFSIAVTNSSVSATVSYPTSSGTGGFGFGTTSGSATGQLQSYFGTAGIKLFELPFSNTVGLSAGDYWFGFMRRYSSSSANIGISMAVAGNVATPIVNRGNLGVASSAATTNPVYKQPLQGMGPYTSTGQLGYSGIIPPTYAYLTGFAHTMTIRPCFTLDRSQ